jgi:hypothetical protein
MGVPRMSTYPPWHRHPWRMRLVYWLGQVSRQFRENWHHNTGTWLWGQESFDQN